MFDKHLIVLTEKALTPIAKVLVSKKISANTITIFGFFVGLISVLCISQNMFLSGLLFLLVNRVFDGLDGIVARLTSSSDNGAFLDITLDFVFYGLFPLGFVISNPDQNSLPGIVLVVSFFATGSSFLAFSILAERRQLKVKHHTKNKGIYYIESFIEGGETAFFFCVMCLFPSYFPYIAYLFAFLCFMTWILRVKLSFIMFKD